MNDTKYTCSECKHMGRKYHEGIFTPYHICGKSGDRRKDALPPLNLHTNLDVHFRTFFDASPKQAACKYFESISREAQIGGAA